MKKSLTAALLAALLCFVAESKAQTGPSSSTQYQAFGDSITCGAGAFTLSNAFEYWVGRAFGNTPVPHCLAGDDSYLIDGFIMDPANAVVASPTSISSLLEGSNNISGGLDSSHIAL